MTEVTDFCIFDYISTENRSLKRINDEKARDKILIFQGFGSQVNVLENFWGLGRLRSVCITVTSLIIRKFML